MHQCEDCGHCTKGVKLVDEHETDESMRVFCLRHDMHDARYTSGRPLIDDTCPLCVMERLKELLVEAKDMMNINRIEQALGRTATRR